MSHSSLSSVYNAFNRAHAKNMRMIIPRKVLFLPNQLANKEHACVRESWETFHWSLTNLKMFLCDFCAIYVIDCKTVRIFASSSTRQQSNKRSGTRLKTRPTGVWGSRASRATLLRHVLPISLPILRKKNRLFCGLFMYWVKCNGARMVLSPSLYLFRKEKKPWKVRMKNLRALFSCIVIGDFGRERNARGAQGGREGNSCKEAIDLAIPPTIYVCKNIATVND